MSLHFSKGIKQVTCHAGRNKQEINCFGGFLFFSFFVWWGGGHTNAATLVDTLRGSKGKQRKTNRFWGSHANRTPRDSTPKKCASKFWLAIFPLVPKGRKPCDFSLGPGEVGPGAARPSGGKRSGRLAQPGRPANVSHVRLKLGAEGAVFPVVWMLCKDSRKEQSRNQAGLVAFV